MTVLLAAGLFGCSTDPVFDIRSIAKTDVDQISEIHLRQVTGLTRELTRKLYKRNPAQLRKIPGQTIEIRIQQIFQCPAPPSYPEINHTRGPDAILKGLDPMFDGDRVFAVMYGLYTMVLKSYNDKCELFIPDYLNNQYLYNSARNIEILVWRLKVRKDTQGQPLLLTDSFDDPVPNLSFERIFGKLIAHQDTMALVVSGRTNRVIREVVQMAGMAFLPVGF